MAKTGKIVRVSDKGFGFLKADDDGVETFIHRSSYPGKMEMLEGDVIEYDIEDTERGSRATKIKVLERGSPPPATANGSPPTTRPAPTATATPISHEIEVNWSYGTPTSNALPLTLTLTANKQARVGVEITLKSNGTKVSSPDLKPSTDGKGQVTFLVPLTASTKLCALAATVKGGKTYTHIWEKRDKATTATPATSPADHPKLPDIEVVKPPRDPDPDTGLFVLTVLTRKHGANTNRPITVISTPEPVEILQERASGLEVVTKYTPMAVGQYRLFVRLKGVQVKLTLRLDDMKETVVHLRK